MAIATINRLITCFSDAFKALSSPVAMADIEDMAMLVHHSMSAKARVYHTAHHVFDMCEGMNPRQVLAALFHDLVYVQLDGGFPLLAAPLLDDVARRQDSSMILREINADDTALALCADLFGFAPGQTLPPYGGMNEFLSAVVAVRCLQRHLNSADLIAVVACIEATIPFRGPAPDGLSAAETLARRVQVQRGLLLPELDPQEMASYVKTVTTDAVHLSNRDVAGFGEADPGRFLSSTWLLIEESNAPLAAVGVYSVQQYRSALMRMDSFLASLDPLNVFQSHGNDPSPRRLTAMNAAAKRNIAFSCAFLDAKIASIAIIEALARCTGGDCPVSMFLGDISSTRGRPIRAEDFLPTPPSCAQPTSAALLKVLEKGRTVESSNDLTTSPLTAFVYRFIGHAGMHLAMDQARQMFDGTLAAPAFLSALDRDMVRAITHACAQVAVSRRDALLALEKSL